MDEEAEIKILFVDDEPKILKAIERMLFDFDDEWEMHFIESGAEAIQALKSESFDIIISDMRMPGITGDELLKHVRDHHPQTIRIALSGHADTETISNLIGTAHQFILKPCKPEVLEETIKQTLYLRTFLTDPDLEKLTAGISDIPSLPQVYSSFIQELHKDDPCFEKVVHLIETDAGLASRILQLVNSAFYGVGSKVIDIFEAASILGLETLKTLIILINALPESNHEPIKGLSLKSFWIHSQMVSRYAKMIATHLDQPKAVQNEAQTLGLLHDLGKLILMTHLPKPYQEVYDLHNREKISVYDAEKQIIGATHAQIGAYIMGIWGLSKEIFEGIAWHHTPWLAPEKKLNSVTFIYLANLFAYRSNPSAIENKTQLNQDYLDSVGLNAEKVKELQDICLNPEQTQ